MADASAHDRHRLFWDFFGPDALKTAEHFQRHLGELFAAEGIAGCGLGLESRGRGHQAVCCTAPAAVADELVRRLRPRRVERPSMPQET